MEYYLQRLAEPFQHSCHVLLISVNSELGHFEKFLKFVQKKNKTKRKLDNSPTYPDALFTWNIKELLNLGLHSLRISIFQVNL